MTDSISDSPALARLKRLEQFLLQDHDNMPLLAETAEAALAAGDFVRAEQLIGAGLGSPAAQPAWRFRQASLRIAQRRLDEAHDILFALRQDSGEHPSVAHNLAYVAFLRGEFATCLDILEPWIDFSGAAQDTQALQVLWLRAMHHLGRLDEAWRWALRQLGKGALSLGASGVASLIAVDMEHMDEALDLSQRLLDAGESQVEALVARASVAIARGDRAHARRLLDDGLKLSPQDGRTWSTLGFLEMVEKRFDQARAIFERTVVLIPRHIETWHGLGWACMLLRDPSSAAAAFDAALRLDPGLAESHGARAVVHALQGERILAQEHVERATALDGSDFCARYAQAILSGQPGAMDDLENLVRGLLGARVD